MMHPEDPKSRDHNSLGFGVTGDVAILNDSYLVGQTGSSLNNGSIYIYNTNESKNLLLENIFPPSNIITGYKFGHSIDALGDILKAPPVGQVSSQMVLYQF